MFPVFLEEICNMSKKILFTRIYPKIAQTQLQEAGFKVTLRETDTPFDHKELIEKSKEHDAILCTLTDKIDDTFLNECSHMDIISQFAVGYDNINVEKATELGIPIGHTPEALNEATADIAFGLLLATSRKMFHQHKKIIHGKWGSFTPIGDLGIEIKNKTLGIFGLGRIGMEMAKLCKAAYNMNVIYHNRSRNKHAEKTLDATYVPFEELLTQSDVISLHCNLNEGTREIFNKDAFQKMKSRAIFINTARGPVHNESDLINALQTGEIWGAGLDVTNPEPMNPNNELLQMPNVCVLPHIGSGTEETRDEMARMAANNIIEFYKSGTVPNVVNPEAIR